MTLCETTVQHFLLLAPLYSHRKGLSVCHNQTSVCLKTSTAPLETLSLDSCKQPAFCWVQFLQNGKSEARSQTPELSSIRPSESRWIVSFPCSGTFSIWDAFVSCFFILFCRFTWQVQTDQNLLLFCNNFMLHIFFTFYFCFALIVESHAFNCLLPSHTNCLLAICQALT